MTTLADYQRFMAARAAKRDADRLARKRRSQALQALIASGYFNLPIDQRVVLDQQATSVVERVRVRVLTREQAFDH